MLVAVKRELLVISGYVQVFMTFGMGIHDKGGEQNMSLPSATSGSKESWINWGLSASRE